MGEELLGFPVRTWLIAGALLIALLLFAILGITNGYDSIVGLLLQFRVRIAKTEAERDDYKQQAYNYAVEASHYQGMLYLEQMAHYETRRDLDLALSERNRYHTALDKLSQRIQERKDGQ